MTHSSPRELAIGVPVAKVATRSTTAVGWNAGGRGLLAAALAQHVAASAPRSSARSEAFVQASSSMLQTRCRFLYMWASSIEKVVSTLFFETQPGVLAVLRGEPFQALPCAVFRARSIAFLARSTGGVSPAGFAASSSCSSM